MGGVVLLCPAVIMFIHHYQFYSVAIIVIIIIIIIIIIIFAEVTTMKGVDRIKCFFVIGTRMFLNKVPKRKAKKESQYCDNTVNQLVSPTLSLPFVIKTSCTDCRFAVNLIFSVPK